MTRMMGDATGPNAGSLPAGLDLVAGYVTGGPDVIWTAAQQAAHPGMVTIDQAFTGSPVPSAIVRDVEPGAWSPAAAVTSQPWTAARPTIYCNRSNLPAVLAAGWQGDLWLAFPGWLPGQSLPAAPGCTIVAVQNQINVGGAYDLSVVLDPAWPAPAHQEDDMLIIEGAADGAIYLLSGGKVHHITSPTAVAAYQAAGIQIVTQAPGEVAALVADFPPGNPAVTVTTTTPNLTISGTITPV